MKISIITPTYNSQETIIRNINSVNNQSYKNLEHIIIDNKSTDDTVELVKKKYAGSLLDEKLKIIIEKDNGISEAFNKGIKAAEGEIVGILNSDDYYYDNTVFERIKEAFRNDKNLFVHGNILFVDSVYGTNIRRPLLCPITTAMPYNHPTMFFRKSVYDEYGFFDLSYKYAMDFEFVCRFEKQITDFRERGEYIKGGPLTVVHAGGISWKNEIGSIVEGKTALQLHGFWNLNAKWNYILRMFRTRLKNIILVLKLNIVVKLWRNMKWRNGVTSFFMYI